MLVLGKVISFDSTPWTAVVEIRGSRLQRMVDVPVNRGIASGDMVAGRLCLVYVAGDGKVEASCVVAVW